MIITLHNNHLRFRNMRILSTFAKTILISMQQNTGIGFLEIELIGFTQPAIKIQSFVSIPG